MKYGIVMFYDVDVSGCPAVTRDGVKALRTGCRAMKKLVDDAS